MKVTISTTGNFKSDVKPLLKKYHSLNNDLLNLEKELIKTPGPGVPPGSDTYKIRLKITSKGKGKSGGARVITLVETTLIGLTTINPDNEITVNLLSIFDKSETENISDKELRDLIRNFKNNK